MRRGMGVVIALMLICSLVAVAGDKAPLSDRQLSSITAGSDFGASGAVVANGSSASIVKNGSVNLKDSAQSDVKALNVLNSSTGAIGVGINVWEGNPTTYANGFRVLQNNTIVASFGGGAHVDGYFRDPSISVKDASLKANFSNTQLAVELAFARTANRLDVAAASDRTFALDEAAAISQKIFGYTHATGTSPVVLGYGRTNAPSSSFTQLFGESAWAAQFLHARAAESQRFRLSAASEAEALAAALEYAKTTFGLDLSIGSFGWKGAMGFDDADAEYVVVDDSKLSVTENYGIALGGEAQSKISAVNVVNAVGSLVGIGTNVARTPADSDHLRFSQINTIILK